LSILGAFYKAATGGVTASSTDTFTNKTVDGDGTGNTYSNMLNESAEASASDGAQTSSAGVNGTRMYGFETLPTTEKWYIITGIEWKNGATVSGNVMSGVDLVNANPPTVNNTQLVATSIPVAQSGTNAVQRTSQIVSMPIRGGSVIGMWFNQDNNTGTVGYGTVTSLNHQKIESYTSNPTVTNTASWGAGTTQRYTKVYYRGFS